jgi:RNA polymerase sigma factor (sigma-70 family)
MAGTLSTFVGRLPGVLGRQNPDGPTDDVLLDGFLSRRDEAAFEALVRRHGRMVLGVCRRIAGNEHDAEDAFQATFLVLVRKAESVRPRAMVGNWLYGVARRTARDARKAAAKRRAKEAAMPPRSERPDHEHADLRAVLDDELRRLPEKSRAVIVLSDLEGMTRAEVARQLGWPEGSVASRLARARARLAKRLARFGPAAAGALVGTLLSEGAASATVPTSLVVSTVKTASLRTAGTGAIPAPVAALAEGVMKAMLFDKLKTALPMLIALSIASLTCAVLAVAGGDPPGPFQRPPKEGKGEPRQNAPAAALGSPAGRADNDTPKKDDAVKKAYDQLKGVWACVGYEKNGQVYVGKPAREAMWNEQLWFQTNTPAGNWVNMNWERNVGGWKSTGTAAHWKLDPSTKPKGIDLTWQGRAAPEYMPKGIDPAWEAGALAEKYRGETQLGVYSADGDKLRLAWSELGKARPTSLTTKPGDKWTVHLYERKKE